MATYSADIVTTTTPVRYRESGPVTVISEYSGSASLSAGDVIQMVKVDKGAKLAIGSLIGNTLSTSATANLQLGDGIDPNRYLSAQVGGTKLGQIDINAGVGYEYSAADTVDVRVNVYGTDGTTAPNIKLVATIIYDDSSVR